MTNITFLLFFVWYFLGFTEGVCLFPSAKPDSSRQFIRANNNFWFWLTIFCFSIQRRQFVWAKWSTVFFHIFSRRACCNNLACIVIFLVMPIGCTLTKRGSLQNKRRKDVALGISRHVFLYVKQMAICYTNRSRYGKRQRSPSEKRSTEHENTHSQYRTVNYCFFFCYSVFWIPTQQDTIFILNRISTTVTNDIIDHFQQTFPKMKKREKLRVHVEHNTVTSYCLFVCLLFFGSNVLTHSFFFFSFFFFRLFVFLITTLQRKAVTKIHTGSGFSKRNKEKSPLAYVH